MKKTLLFAIIAMAVATMVTVVSCKKDDQNVKFNNSNSGQSVSHFDPSHITDMNAYLKEFKQQMRQSQYAKDAEMLSLEEAAWHLSSVANYDFANVRDEYTDVRRDTIYKNLAVTNGEVSMADLEAVYGEISSDLDGLYHSLDLENKHFRFIGVDISEEGRVEVSTLVTFGWWYGIDQHLWYFPDAGTADSFCDYHFSSSQPYYASGLGRSEIERVLNLTLGHPTDPNTPGGYYTISTTKSFYYRDYIDPYQVSPSYMYSRLFATDEYLNPDISAYMCYLFDSYASLALENAPDGMAIVQVKVDYRIEEPFAHLYERFWKGIHTMTVHYGHHHHNENNQY